MGTGEVVTLAMTAGDGGEGFDGVGVMVTGARVVTVGGDGDGAGPLESREEQPLQRQEAIRRGDLLRWA